MTTPRLYLDVDGVLNLVVERVPSFAHRSYTAGAFRITWYPPVVDTLRRWLADGRVTITWLTTWEAMANERIGAPMGLPELPVARREDAPTGGDFGPWWKLATVQGAYDEGTPVIWIDDDIAGEPSAERWIARADEDRLLTISPDPEAGLTEDDLARVDHWLRRRTQARA